MIRPCDAQSCVICSHSITIDQDGCVCTVPTKRLARLSVKTKEAFLVKWDERKSVNYFHWNCYRELQNKKISTRFSSTEKRLLDEIEEIVERYNSLSTLNDQIKEVADLIRAAERRVVCFTGAGISASAGIPTYRGVDGIDTLAELSKPNEKDHHSDEDAEEEDDTDYAKLQPTYTHRFLSTMHQNNNLSYVITQNCDNLHAKGGLPRTALSELHGNVFIEYCEQCFTQYQRDYCVDAYSTCCTAESWYVQCNRCNWNHYTGRYCDNKRCKGRLRDTIVNFGDLLFDGIWPEGKILGGLRRARQKAKAAKVCLCLGSSLTVTPANELPTLCQSLVIVNPQQTELDENAVVRLWTTSDIFCKLLNRELYGNDEECKDDEGDERVAMQQEEVSEKITTKRQISEGSENFVLAKKKKPSMERKVIVVDGDDE